MADRTINGIALDRIRQALSLAEEEIHHPGASRYGNYDILDMIDQAKKLCDRAMADQPTQGVPG